MITLKHKINKLTSSKIKLTVLAIFLIFGLTSLVALSNNQHVVAADNPYAGTNQCGNLEDNDENYKTKFNFGCLGSEGPKGLNPIEDLLYAFFRFLSVGVGIVVVIAIIIAGIQYSTSEGNAEATQNAKGRIRSAIIGLVLYMFAFSIFQFLVPGGLFKPGAGISTYRTIKIERLL